MSRPEGILKRVRIAAPCPTRWENMEGDERTRYCSLCKLNVYNLSDMTSKEAAKLVSEAEGRLCVRFYQRRDGTVLTKDCPVGVRAIRKRLTSSLACLFVLFTAGIAYASNIGRRGSPDTGTSALMEEARNRIRKTEPFKTVLEWIDPPKPIATNGAPYPGRMIVLGAMASPPISARPLTPGKKSTP